MFPGYVGYTNTQFFFFGWDGLCLENAMLFTLKKALVIAFNEVITDNVLVHHEYS
jgi:hypothetical protein